MKRRTLTRAVVVLALLPLYGSPQATSAQDADWDFIRVHAPRQQVEVKTGTGSFTATFQNEAVVHPTGRAAGGLSLTVSEGATIRFHVVAGRVRLRDGAATEVRLLLRKVGADAGDDFDVVVVRPAPAPAQDCLIYDLVGPPVHLEAQGRIEVIRF